MKLLFLMIFLFGCSYGGVYIEETVQSAEQLMSEMDDFILIDVRTPAEFQGGGIDGAISIPHNEILDRAELELPDKDIVIFVYCQTGRRSAIAAKDLSALGFLRVYDLGGLE